MIVAYVCVLYVCSCGFVHVEARGEHLLFSSMTFDPFSSRQGSSLPLKCSRVAVSKSFLFSYLSFRVEPKMCGRSCLACYLGAGLELRSLWLVQQTLWTPEPPLQPHCPSSALMLMPSVTFPVTSTGLRMWQASNMFVGRTMDENNLTLKSCGKVSRSFCFASSDYFLYFFIWTSHDESSFPFIGQNFTVLAMSFGSNYSSQGELSAHNGLAADLLSNNPNYHELLKVSRKKKGKITLSKGAISCNWTRFCSCWGSEFDI